jgi:uncharacterized RDD family membrane protein YckC
MPWQYMQDGEIRGPLGDLEFDHVRRSLDSSTKVHKEGWKEWRKLEDVPSSEFPQPPPPPPLDESLAKPAGFLRRAGAILIDYFLIRWLVGQLGLGGSFWHQDYSGNGFWGSYASYSDSSWSDHLGWPFAFTLLYETLLTWRFGWTLGKFVFGIQVRHQGQKLSWQRSLMRVLAKKLNLITLMIGYLMAAWDKDQKALHDYLCKTRVFLR